MLSKNVPRQIIRFLISTEYCFPYFLKTDTMGANIAQALAVIIGAASIHTSRSFVATHTGLPSPCIPTRHNIIIHAAIEDGSDVGAGVEEVSLASLGNDHEEVGEKMAQSIAAWLDEEWMPQEVHVKMGVSAKNSYVTCRNNGKNEVAEIMTQVTDGECDSPKMKANVHIFQESNLTSFCNATPSFADLFERWSEYNADAFVNAWDIGNYVADYLIQKSGGETCACSAKVVE